MWVNKNFLYCYCLCWGTCRYKPWARLTLLVCDEKNSWFAKINWQDGRRFGEKTGEDLHFMGNCSAGGEGVLRRDFPSSMSHLLGLAACPWCLLQGLTGPCACSGGEHMAADGAAAVPAAEGESEDKAAG